MIICDGQVDGVTGLGGNPVFFMVSLFASLFTFKKSPWALLHFLSRSEISQNLHLQSGMSR